MRAASIEFCKPRFPTWLEVRLTTTRYGGSVWESNPPLGSRRAESPALKAGKITGSLSPPQFVRIISVQSLQKVRNLAYLQPNSPRPGAVFDRMRSTSICSTCCAKAAHREIGAPGSSHAGRRERRALIRSKQCGYEIKQRWRSANFVVGMLGRHAEFSILQ